MLKKLKVLIMVIMCIIILCGNVISFAETNSCTVTLDTNKTQIKKGETITVLIKASNIQGDGIAMFNANVNYDSNIFECVASGSDSGEWIMQGFIENNLSIARADLLANKQNQTIGKLVFTAKQDATLGAKEISLTQIEFSTGDVSFEVLDATKQIEIIIGKIGDPNDDGIINTTDLLMVLRHIAADKNEQIKQNHSDWILTGDKFERANVNKDNAIDITDVIKILRHISASKNLNTANEHSDWIIK